MRKSKQSEYQKQVKTNSIVGYGPLLNTVHHRRVIQSKVLQGKWLKIWFYANHSFLIAFVLHLKQVSVANFFKIPQTLRPIGRTLENNMGRRTDKLCGSKSISILKDSSTSNASQCRTHPHQFNIPLCLVALYV